MIRPSGMTQALEFYQQGLGLSLVRSTDEWAEFQLLENIRLSLQTTSSEASLCTGYSPLLQFSISDMDQTISQCLQRGAHLDGPIQYPAHGKVAALRTPTGHMIGLYEPNLEGREGGGE